MASAQPADVRQRRSNFGKTRSLSQYAVSLPGQPEDVSGVHPRDDKFHFFKKGRDYQSRKAKHHYTADELRVLATYESADNLPSHTEVFRKWLEELPPRGNFETWGIVSVVGFAVGVLAFVLKECNETLQIFKNPFVGDYIERGEIYRLWMYYAAMSCSLAGVSAMVCVYLCPFAAGSGVPELIGILNGVVIRNMLSFKTLIFKIISCLLSVASGLPIGFEGPMVHFGAMLGASLARPTNCRSCLCKSRPHSGTFPLGNDRSPSNKKTETKSGCCCWNRTFRYRDCKERHNLICMGAAAGVSAAFSAPITGLLFSMEEMSSFWTAVLTWQTFVCCIIARSVMELLRSVVTSLHQEKKGSFASLFEFSESALFDTKEEIRLNLLVIIPTIMIGIIGGLIGALFIFMHLKIARFRRKILSKIKRVEMLNGVKVFEPILVAFLCSIIIMGSLQLFECKPLEHEAEIYSAHEGKFLRFHHFRCERDLNLTFTEHRVLQNGEYHEFATLVFGSWEQMIRNLLSRKTADKFSIGSLAIILVFFFVFCSWSSQCFIANGLLIPQLAVGSLYGRLLGRLMCDMFEHGNLTDVKEGCNGWEWLDPGLFALLGAASFMSGTARLPVTSVVMLIEMTNDINVSLLVMIVVMISKFIGDLLTHPLYHSLLEFKCIPHLEDELKVYRKGKGVNLELFKAADVMASPVDCVDVNESLQVLANLLLDTNHGAFPVVESGFGFKRTFLGMITRLELTILLTKTVGFSLKEISKDDMDRIRISYPEYSSSKLQDTNITNEILNNYAEHPQYEGVTVNLLPYINTSSYIVPSQFSLHRTYLIFRNLGARHLIVVDTHNQVMGIITRKDLMGFAVDEKIMAILDKRKDKGRPAGDFSPKCMLNCWGGHYNSNVASSSTTSKPYLPSSVELNHSLFDLEESEQDISVRARARKREGHSSAYVLQENPRSSTSGQSTNDSPGTVPSPDGNPIIDSPVTVHSLTGRK